MVGIITKNTELPGPVLWPETDTDKDVTDLAQPLRLLLVNLGISPDPDDTAADGFAKSGVDVPPSVAIIEAGATEASKLAANQMKLSALAAGAVGALGAFWTGAGGSVQVVVVAGAAVVLATLLIAIALIVSSDVRARGSAAAAQYDARARVAEAYLRGAVCLGPKPPAGAAGAAAAANGQAAVNAQPGCVDARTLSILLGANRDNGVSVTLDGDDDHHVANRTRLDVDGSVHLHCGNGGWRQLSEIRSFDPA